MTAVNIPQKCIYLQTHPEYSQLFFIFTKDSLVPWFLILIYFLAYSTVIRYFWHNRKKASFRTRSPRLMIMGFLFIMLNSIINTLCMIRFGNYDSAWRVQCINSVISMMFCFIGYSSMYLARMYRVFHVFTSYQEHLDDQLNSIKEENLFVSQD
jgi:hypothetical protein